MDTKTQTFKSAIAAHAAWDSLAERCLDQLGGLSGDANLGFLYVTDMLAGDLARILDRLRARTGIRDWVGTIGFGVCAAGHEYFDQPALGLLVGQLPPDSYRILPTMTRPGQEMPGELAGWTARSRPLLGVVHADPRNAYLPAILNSIYDDTESFLVGGLTASRGAAHQVAGGLTEGGISGVLLGSAIPVVTGLTQGCSPISAVHEVTRGRDNVVMELDGKPALAVFRAAIGEVLARDMSRIAGYIHVALPIPGSDTGDYLVRNLVGVDPRNGGVMIGERVGKGDRLMFVRRDGPSAMKDLNRMLDGLSSRLEHPPQAALYFSCVARGPNLFGPDSEEMRTVGAALPGVPLVGFYANGEICNSRVYGYTGVLALFV